MANIANLTVQLTAKTGAFAKGLFTARKKVKSFSKGVRLDLGGVKRAFAFLAGGFLALRGLRAFINTFNELRKELNDLASVSDKLGILPEQLAGLQLASEIANVPINQLNLGIQRMGRRIAEAAVGTGEAQGALKALGLDAKKLNRLNIAEQFFVIAEAMESVTNANDRLRLAFKLFDSEGVALVNILALGGDEMERIQRQAKRLGLAVSRADLAKIELMNSQFILLGKTFKGFFRQLLVQFAPFIGGITNMIQNFLEKGRDIPKMLFDAFIRGGKFVEQFIFNFRVAIKQLRIDVLMITATMVELFQKAFSKIMGTLSEALIGIGIAFDSGALQKVIGFLTGIDTKQLREDLVSAGFALGKSAAKMANQMEGVPGSIREAAKELQNELNTFIEGGPTDFIGTAIKRFMDQAGLPDNFFGDDQGDGGVAGSKDRGQFQAGKAALTAFGGPAKNITAGDQLIAETIEQQTLVLGSKLGGLNLGYTG